MLDRTAALETVSSPAPESGASQWRRVVFPDVEPQHATALSALYRRRPERPVQIGGHRFQLCANWLRDETAIAEPCSIDLMIDGEPAQLVVPRALLSLAAADLGPGVDLDALHPKLRALLLEFAIGGELEQIEAAMGITLALETVETHGVRRTDPDHPVVLLVLQSDAAGVAAQCMLWLPAAHMLRLARYLDATAGTLPQPPDLPVPVALRWSSVALTVGELRSLAPGDIVQLDQFCRNPGTAVAVFADHSVAEVEMSATGCVVQGPIQPAETSPLAWSIGRAGGAQAGSEGSVEEVTVPVFFDFAAWQLSSAAIEKLQPGAILDVPASADAALAVVVNGARLATGEPTTIGNGLGVRIVRM
jgi:flagellar motor switch/type III secretory pathway protein FliN